MERTCVYITETVDVERRRGANYCEARPAHGSGTGSDWEGGAVSSRVPAPSWRRARPATGRAAPTTA
jgi:hypothetical protein